MRYLLALALLVTLSYLNEIAGSFDPFDRVIQEDERVSSVASGRTLSCIWSSNIGVCSHKLHPFGSMNRSRGFDSLTQTQKPLYRFIGKDESNEPVAVFCTPSGHRGCYNLTFLQQSFR